MLASSARLWLVTFGVIISAAVLPAAASAAGAFGPQSITATGTAVAATEGWVFSGPVATFADPGGATVASQYGSTVDWGDGSAVTEGAVDGGDGSFTVSGSHTFAESGSYTVTVTTTDLEAPLSSATTTSSATVGDAAFTADCGASGESSKSFSGPVADLLDANRLGTAADFTASVDYGDGSSSSGAVTGSRGSYTVSGTHSYGSTGTFTITTTVTDGGGASSSASCSVLVYGFAPGGGAFVVGDQSAHGTVTFWGAQWWKVNDLSGDSAPPAFKGFALNAVAAPGCGDGVGSASAWSTAPGNSPPPPAGPLPDYMAVIVSDSIGKSGPVISGNTVRVVVVHTDPGYEGNPGHAGTGTVVKTVSLSGCDL